MRLLPLLGLCGACTGHEGSNPPASPPGAASTEASLEDRDTDGDGWPDVADCGPADPAVYPGAPERCNRIDDNCNGSPDDRPIDPIAIYDDLDGDGYGDPTTLRWACDAGPNEATRADDCNDSDSTVHPSSPEVCWSGQDDDCDGSPGTCGPSGTPTTNSLTARWWGQDGDRVGTAAVWSQDPTGSGATGLLLGAPGATLGAGGVVWVETPLQDGGTVLPTAVGTGIDQLGTSLVAPGDIDGDGLPDVLAGAPGAASARGAVRLFLGDPTGLAAASDVVTGLVAGDSAGETLAAGDGDGDGLMDLAVGIPNDVSSGRRGRVAILAGPLHRRSGTFELADAQIVGIQPGGGTGQAISFDGDANGDGHADLVVGTPTDNAGRFDLFYGPMSGTISLDDADRAYRSDGTAWSLGTGVAWLGDTDSDGTDDLAVSAPSGPLNGAVLLFYGDDLDGGPGRLDSSTVGAAVLGTTYAAGGVARIGDVNGDGRPDVHAGGPGIHWSPLEGGIEAEDADLWLTPGSLDGERDVPGWLPAQVGSGADPDLDGDGYAELIFAGPGLSPFGRDGAGEAQVLSPAGY